MATALQGQKKYIEGLKVVNTGLARKAVSDDKNLVNLRDILKPLADSEANTAKRGMASNMRLKTEGNEFFKKREFQKAIDKYDAAAADSLTQPVAMSFDLLARSFNADHHNVPTHPHHCLQSRSVFTNSVYGCYSMVECIVI